MLQNYLKIALRNLARNKVYSFINIFGLALGVACCLLLTLYIQDEWSYDKHHAHLENIYRITTQFESDRGINKLGTSSPPIAPTLMEELIEVESAARVLNPPGVAQNLIKYKDNIFYETNGFLADSTLFDVLTYELKEGNPKNALTEANTVVISETLATKLFGSESALDKNILISQGGPETNFTITGVFRENTRSHIKANFFASMLSSGWAEYMRSDAAAKEWAGQNFVPSYVRLSEGHNKKDVEQKMNDILTKYGAEGMKALGMTKTLALEPVKDIYLKSDIGRSPRITYIYVIASIAFFILLIACINFMNLSTAKATKRAAEIGIRKVMGAFRSSLIRQILGEAMVIVILAILISIVMLQVGLPFFNQVTGKSISFGSENILYFILALGGITVVTGLVAGSYPAFYLSSFQPAQVLKGKFHLNNASGWLRQGLVVFQFMIAITLVCGMIVISQQLKFMQEKDLGFDATAKVVLPLRTPVARQQYLSLKDQLESNNAIKQVAGTEYVPGTPIFSDMMYYSEGGNMDKAILHTRNTVDAGYMNLLGIKLIAGRPFSDNPQSESRTNIIVNRASAKRLGFEPDQLVGQPLYFDWQGTQYTFHVIGVMEDYHQTSLKENINPIVFEIATERQEFPYLIASINTLDFNETTSFLEKTWKNLVNDTPFEYYFLDESIQKQYSEDQKVSQIITAFTLIAMIICSLGLYGLSTYLAERRFKEIGVRKVMGASVGQIVGMMSQEFVKLVLIAFVISVPLAAYILTEWLSSFAYHVPLSGWVFVYAGTTAILIALITVAYESLKAASVNPVQSLRNE
ncbi:MAG: antimicrobial peptide ABC transporter permease [Bacteroidetes bacterium OLB12]|nr:MAG: antimicrobial peptide ABC transporter permease [Bacteroidetes bacterium OLB12]